MVFQALLPALRDVSLVFHCASPAPASDDRALFERVNIQGTRTVIQACLEAAVQVRQPSEMGCVSFFSHKSLKPAPSDFYCLTRAETGPDQQCQRGV